MLISDEMSLSTKEQSWLPWLGKNGKLALGWSCFINRSTYSAVEQTFEGIAATRVKLLHNWTATQWEHLTSLSELIKDDDLAKQTTHLNNKLTTSPDFSELFIVDLKGEVICSTYTQRTNIRHKETRALEIGIQKPFLHGPYIDQETLAIGASSSKFHDEVTLMFYQPIIVNAECQAVLCGRVPNDVLGDLIQREAGHVYSESGDNYLFMVDAQFDPSIRQGTALSRSRFEDNTFSHGENLKSGVHTDYGVVKVNRHTEFEVRFTDPATGELHPGVRETIKNGQNLFVKYPGYSDYRHIPVIGKGVTFKLQGSLDTWGMMCEGDLEEVYRRRSINLSLIKMYLFSAFGLLALNTSLCAFTELSIASSALISSGGLILSAILFSIAGTNKVSNRLNEMTSVIRTIAEGEGNLTQRLDPDKIKHDETGDMSRWINSFIDNLDHIVGQVINASHEVKSTNEQMLHRNSDALNSSQHVHQSMLTMQELIQKQRTVILEATNTAEDMKSSMANVVAKAKHDYEDARSGTHAIRNIVENTAQSVQSIDERMGDIGNIINVITEITNQTNLLALK